MPCSGAASRRLASTFEVFPQRREVTRGDQGQALASAEPMGPSGQRETTTAQRSVPAKPAHAESYLLKESLDRPWTYRYGRAALRYLDQGIDHLRWQRLERCKWTEIQNTFGALQPLQPKTVHLAHPAVKYPLEQQKMHFTGNTRECGSANVSEPSFTVSSCGETRPVPVRLRLSALAGRYQAC